MRSPLDQAISARNRPGQRALDAEMRERERQRRVEDVPGDFNPLQILGASAGAETARVALGGLYETWTLIRHTASETNVDMRELGRISEQALSRGLAGVDRAITGLETQEAALSNKIREIIQPRVSDAFAGEVRTWLRHELRDRSGKVNRSRLGKFLEEMKGDKRLASAVLEAPAVLSGLDEAGLDLVRGTAVTTWAADTDAELRELQKARAKLDDARDRAIRALGPKIATWSAHEPASMGRLRAMGGGR